MVPVGAPVGLGQLVLQTGDRDALALDDLFEVDEVPLDAGERIGGVKLAA
jgi:hypothetical protein